MFEDFGEVSEIFYEVIEDDSVQTTVSNQNVDSELAEHRKWKCS